MTGGRVLAKAASAEETPMMRQYLAMKARVGEAILLYRMGDFYETFGQDAVDASRILGLTLTARGNGAAEKVPLAGFPHHQIERYLPRLVTAGRKVAVCEQMEDPALAKGVVKRDLVEIVSRGTTLSEACLDERTDNLLAAILPPERDEPWGLAALDLTTGRFEAMEGAREAILSELESLIARGSAVAGKPSRSSRGTREAGRETGRRPRASSGERGGDPRP
jgi:DNA mismatch repair protein MutS